MSRFVAAPLAFILLAPSGGAAIAALQSTVLHFSNMMCGVDPHIIREALQQVPGVTAVDISLEQHTAVVTFDNSIASYVALQSATGAAGYPAN
jgi:mercuric ion binding protein